MDSFQDHGGTRALQNRMSTRSQRKSRSKMNKPRKLLDELENRVATKKIGDGILEYYKNEQKEIATFFAFFKPENRQKNLKLDAMLYDRTRVVLTDGTNDYYHASWVVGVTSEKMYCLAQAPIKRTVEDFWRLVGQIKPEAIVFLESCDSDEAKLLLENKKVGSEVEEVDGWEVFKVTETKTKIYSLLGWTEDHKPPQFLDALEKLRETVPHESKSPILVVCKDGGSRSGIFTLIDMEFDRMRKGRTKFVETLRSLRQQRYNAVDTFELFDAALNLFCDMARKHS